MKKSELADLIDALAVRLARLEDDVRALQWKVASLLPPDAVPPQTWTGGQPCRTLSEAAAELGKATEEAYRQRRKAVEAGTGPHAQADGVDISSSSIEINRYDLYP